MNSELIKSIYNSTPNLKFCNFFDGHSPLWDYSKHKHPYIEFIYHLNGKGSRNVSDNTVQDYNSFDAIVYPVNCWHQDKPGSSLDNQVYCIWAEMPSVIIDTPLKVQDNNGELEYLFSAIYHESQTENALEEQISLMIRSLLIQIIKLSEKNDSCVINRIIQYLNINMTNSFSLDELAKQENISKSYLIKQFKEKTGTTVIKYVHKLRIKTAKRLLITTTMSVEEIAYKVGFETPKYFFRIFKESEDISPNSYRKLFLVEHDAHIIT